MHEMRANTLQTRNVQSGTFNSLSYVVDHPCKEVTEGYFR